MQSFQSTLFAVYRESMRKWHGFAVSRRLHFRAVKASEADEQSSLTELCYIPKIPKGGVLSGSAKVNFKPKTFSHFWVPFGLSVESECFFLLLNFRIGKPEGSQSTEISS